MTDRETPRFTLKLADGSSVSGHDEASVRAMVEAMADAEERSSRWPSDVREAMAKLAALFPSMKSVPGLTPWDSFALLAWLCGPAPTSGSWQTARFLLGVWNASTRWGDAALEQGLLAIPEGLSATEKREAQRWQDAQVARLNAPFDVLEAIRVWDAKHAAAFIRWADAPFFP